MPTDLQTFALAFGLVWGLLAAYLVRLHLAQRHLEERLARLERPR